MCTCAFSHFSCYVSDACMLWTLTATISICSSIHSLESYLHLARLITTCQNISTDVYCILFQHSFTPVFSFFSHSLAEKKKSHECRTRSCVNNVNGKGQQLGFDEKERNHQNATKKTPGRAWTHAIWPASVACLRVTWCNVPTGCTDDLMQNHHPHHHHYHETAIFNLPVRWWLRLNLFDPGTMMLHITRHARRSRNIPCLLFLTPRGWASSFLTFSTSKQSTAVACFTHGTAASVMWHELWQFHHWAFTHALWNYSFTLKCSLALVA